MWLILSQLLPRKRFPTRVFWRLPVAVGFCSMILGVLPLGARDAVALENANASGQGCVQVAASDALMAQATFPAKKGDVARQAPTSEKDLLRPMTGKEIGLLISALQPVKLEKGEGWAMHAMVEGSELSLDRMGVLLNDAMTLLSNLQRGEVLGRLRKTPGVTQEEVAWTEKAFQALHDCGQARYDGWGGDPVFRNSIKIVESFRPRLEKVILEGFRRGMYSASGQGAGAGR